MQHLKFASNEIRRQHIRPKGDRGLDDPHQGCQRIRHEGFVFARIPKGSPVMIVIERQVGPVDIAFVVGILQGIQGGDVMMRGVFSSSFGTDAIVANRTAAAALLLVRVGPRGRMKRRLLLEGRRRRRRRRAHGCGFWVLVSYDFVS